MKNENMWDEKWAADLAESITAEIEEAVKEMEEMPAAHVNDMFDHVFAENPWPIDSQKEAYAQSRGDR
jgi:pyruvate dehydrogenase E1 component alpha subunit